MTLQDSPTHLATLLVEAFPNHSLFDKACWVFEAIDANQWDFGPEIEVISQTGARSDLIRRLRDEHPTRREHREEHDERLISVFTELTAYVWAVEVAKLGIPEFVVEPGCPDLRVGDWWIEAKTIERSAAARLRDREERPILRSQGFIVRGAVAARETPVGLISKFQYQLEDSIRKWDRQSRVGSLVTFFNLEAIDFGITREGTRDAVKYWAAEAQSRHGVTLVVIENWRWRTPLFPQP